MDPCLIKPTCTRPKLICLQYISSSSVSKDPEKHLCLCLQLFSIMKVAEGKILADDSFLVGNRGPDKLLWSDAFSALSQTAQQAGSTASAHLPPLAQRPGHHEACSSGASSYSQVFWPLTRYRLPRLSCCKTLPQDLLLVLQENSHGLSETYRCW